MCRRLFVESKSGVTPEALEQSASWGLRKMAPRCPSPWIAEQNFRYVVPCCQCRTRDKPGSRSSEYFSAGSATLVPSQVLRRSIPNFCHANGTLCSAAVIVAACHTIYVGDDGDATFLTPHGLISRGLSVDCNGETTRHERSEFSTAWPP